MNLAFPITPVFAVSNGQWIILALTVSAIAAVLLSARAKRRRELELEQAGVGARIEAIETRDAEARTAERERLDEFDRARTEAEQRRAAERRPQGDLSRGPNLSDGPSLGR